MLIKAIFIIFSKFSLLKLGCLDNSMAQSIRVYTVYQEKHSRTLVAITVTFNRFCNMLHGTIITTIGQRGLTMLFCRPDNANQLSGTGDIGNVIFLHPQFSGILLGNVHLHASADLLTSYFLSVLENKEICGTIPPLVLS